MLPYTWSDLWALDAVTGGLRGELRTVRELAARLAQARGGLARVERVPSWTGPAATAHRDVLARLRGQSLQRALDELDAVARQLGRRIEQQDTRVREMQAALMRQDLEARTAARPVGRG
jgi:uncharacterized protein YukE